MTGDDDSIDDDGPPGVTAVINTNTGPAGAAVTGPPAPPGRQRKVELTAAQVAEKER